MAAAVRNWGSASESANEIHVFTLPANYRMPQLLHFQQTRVVNDIFIHCFITIYLFIRSDND